MKEEPDEESGEEGDLEPLNVPEDLYISEGDEAADEPNSMSYHEVIIYYLGILKVILDLLSFKQYMNIEYTFLNFN